MKVFKKKKKEKGIGIFEMSHVKGETLEKFSIQNNECKKKNAEKYTQQYQPEKRPHAEIVEVGN